MRVLVSLAVALGSVVPHRAAAQLEITPALGLYLPVGVLIESDLASGGEVRRQVGAPLVGFRFTAWPAARLGLEGTVAFSPSQVAVSRAGRTVDFSSSVMLTSARAVLAIGSMKAAWTFHAGAGVGVVSRLGGVWADTRGATAPAAVLAVGVRTRLNRATTTRPATRRAATIRFELEDYFLSAQFDRGLSTQTEARLHHDIAWSIGVAIPIFGP